MSVNRVIIVGRIGDEPDLKYLDNQNAMCKLSIATNYKYNNKEGQDVEETEWHNVTLFGRQAEVASEYLHKGREVYIEGRLKTSQYEKEGQTKYFTQVIGENFKFLGSKNS